jgi:hypothetical protein
MPTSETRTADYAASEQQAPLAGQLAPQKSLWNIPGLDKNTFYAAALYLHAVAGHIKGKRWLRGPKTPKKTRDFLDRLADCFARSKLQDARDHVSATALVRNDELKEITLYIAKNQSMKGTPPLVPLEDLGKIENENIVFADELVRWFNDLARQQEDDDEKSNIFKKMCSFTWSRLEHYIARIGESETADLDSVVALTNMNSDLQDGWEVAKFLINECKLYQDAKSDLLGSSDQSLCLLANYAHLAGQIRKYPHFRTLTDKVETSPPESRLKRLAQTLKWINYLGRLHAAYVSFSEFCRSPEQEGYTFKHCLLPSQEDAWPGNIYMQTIRSWTGELDLANKRDVRKMVDGKQVFVDGTVETYMSEVIRSSGNTARVHCEMQLLMYFSQPNVGKCLDYFGCSKKSCWLCWEMMAQNSQFSMKDTHRKLYPRWAFPFYYSPSQPTVADALRRAYNNMLVLIQDKVINQRALASLGSLPQSSARMTPGPESAHFAGPIITAPDVETFPAVAVPALYLPPDSPEDLRHVTVWAYEVDPSGSRDISTSLMGSTDFNNKSILYAFQMVTKPESFESLSAIIDLQYHYWKDISMIMNETRKAYRIYYRSAEDRLLPNPCLLSAWREVHGEDYRTIPWRGGVFILPELSIFSGTSNIVGDHSSLDSAEILRAVKRHFQMRGAGYAMKQEERGIKSATTSFEILCKWIKSIERDDVDVKKINKLFDRDFKAPRELLNLLES